MFQSLYDFSKKPNYLSRKLFLDKAGPTTIQRFDEYAFPRLAKFYETQRSFFWVPEEINLSKDKNDFKRADEPTRHAFTSNILRQTALDSIQGKAPALIFTPVSSVPELESFVGIWTFFESIHSRAYSHIIKNVYNMPTEEFNKIHDTQEIVQMASKIGKYYDDLYITNCKVGTGQYVSEKDYIKAIYLALIASFGLEAIRFLGSFATSFGMVENKIFIGNGNEISLINQDELLHTDATAYIINTAVTTDQRFFEIAQECQEEAIHMMEDIIAEEKRWSKYLFMKGPVIGLNEVTMNRFIDETAQEQLPRIGIKRDVGIKHPTYPWYKKHRNTSKKQAALQESESTSYVLNAMTNVINIDKLPKLNWS